MLGDCSENGEDLSAATQVGVFVDDNAADMISKAFVVAAFLHKRISGFHFVLPVASQEVAVTGQVKHEAIQSCGRQVQQAKGLREGILTEPAWTLCRCSVGFGDAVDERVILVDLLLGGWGEGNVHRFVSL